MWLERLQAINKKTSINGELAYLNLNFELQNKDTNKTINKNIFFINFFTNKKKI